MPDKSAQPAPQKPKLSLKRETLRVLSGNQLDAVIGGDSTISNSATTSATYSIDAHE
jgi:hypothetical protein